MKDIPGYEGLYAITEDGEVWSYGKKSGPYCNGGFMSICKNVRGYSYVRLYKDGASRLQQIHNLVALTHMPNPENKPRVNHINLIKTDNRVENLEWCTIGENNLHAYRIGGKTMSKEGRESVANKNRIKNKKRIMQLTSEGILCKVYDSMMEAAHAMGAGYSSISGAEKRGGKCRGYFWKYIT